MDMRVSKVALQGEGPYPLQMLKCSARSRSRARPALDIAPHAARPAFVPCAFVARSGGSHNTPPSHQIHMGCSAHSSAVHGSTCIDLWSIEKPEGSARKADTQLARESMTQSCSLLGIRLRAYKPRRMGGELRQRDGEKSLSIPSSPRPEHKQPAWRRRASARTR